MKHEKKYNDRVKLGKKMSMKSPQECTKRITSSPLTNRYTLMSIIDSRHQKHRTKLFQEIAANYWITLVV